MFESLTSGELPTEAVGCVDDLAELERLKALICARQARLADRLDDLTPQASDRGTGAQLGLARRESPHRGRRLLSLARALILDLPQTLAALERGDINEHRAEIIARESQDLTHDDRLRLDGALAPQIASLGDTDVQLATQRLVMRIDEAGAVRRRGRAQARRRITGRRLSDGQAQITAVISEVNYAAIMNSLHERASLELTMGAERSRAQLMADLFVERLTGQVTAQTVPVNLDLVVSAETLLGGGDEPAEILGHGPIPASVARHLVLASPDEATRLRRLFADTDHLIAMESVMRGFDGLLKKFIRVRDQRCRTPFCGARIVQADHVRPVADGGRTTANNGQGLCESCNYTKEEPGWAQRVLSDDSQAHRVEIETPTGHLHRSRAPTPPGTDDPRRLWRQVEPGVWLHAA